MFKPSLWLIAVFLISDIASSLAAKSDECKCGTTQQIATPLIIGGDTVKDVREFPFIVSLYSTEKSKWLGCGGALISPTFILTAAHCVQNSEVKNQTCLEKMTDKCYLTPQQIEVGIFSENSTIWPNTSAEVEKIFPHPHYNKNYSSNDISLIKLKKPLECTNYARPICLSENQTVEVGQDINIAGYGQTDSNIKDSYAAVLQEGVMKLSEENCAGEEHLNVLCAIHEKQSSCEGDSGSVSFIKIEDRYFAVGITSTSTMKMCPVGGKVTFTKISDYYQFIKEYVKDLPNN